MKSKLRLVILSALALGLAVSANAKMLMTPYLQALTDDSVCVLVESDTKDPITVSYGNTTAYGTTAVTSTTLPTTAEPVTYVHRIKLTGLTLNKSYHYKASQGTESSSDYTFKTLVPAGTPFRFAWIADTRSGPKVHNEIAGRIKASNPLFTLFGGDTCVDNRYKSFKNELFVPNELRLMSSVPFYNSPGNHEGWSVNTKAFTESPTFASGTKDYYSFDCGDLHVLCVNNEVPFHEGTAQYNFVKEDLAKTKKTWKVVYAHAPVYCAGGHGDSKAMVKMAEKLFEPNNVDMVVGGHSHFYQHNVVNGRHYYVIGSSGAPLYNPGEAPYVVKSAKSYCYGVIDVTPYSFKMMVYDEKGAVLDTLQLSKVPLSKPAAKATKSSK